MTTISFATTREEMDTILRIISRAEAAGLVHPSERMTLAMDLSACHANGCPLDLAKLEGFPALDFTHDVAGIRRHIDRNTGELRDCFTPRCAQ